MSDHEDETFESADAGASLTYPQQAGTIRKNAYIVINNRPCKVRQGQRRRHEQRIASSSVPREQLLALPHAFKGQLLAPASRVCPGLPMCLGIQVADVSTSKTGKHGHAKCHFVGIDIFTGKKYEDLTPSSHNCDVPNVARNEYTLIDINEDGFVSLMEENGSTRDDLKLPYGTDESEKLAEQLKIDFGEGKEIVVSVLKAMGEEMINSMKVVQSKA